MKKAGKAADWDDDNGHGTHIAGVIAAVDNTIGTIGVAPAAKLFVVKVLAKDYLTKPNQIDPKVIADGIYACISNGVHIINMSFGIAKDETVVRNAIVAASNAGIVLVASVGDDRAANVLYPAKYPQVVAVSAIQQNGVTGQAAAHVTGVAALMLSAGKTDLVGKDVIPVPLPAVQQGLGLIDAWLTVTSE